MDRLEAAVVELVAALREQVAAGEHKPTELLSIEEAALRLGVSRTSVYGLIGNGRLRTIKIGRRRLVPSSALAELRDGLPW